MPLEHYLNPDFDQNLRGAPSLLETGDPTYAHEMAWHYVPAALPDESVIVHKPLPPDFLAYAAAKGLALPRVLLHPSFTPRAEFAPFGWDAHAESLARRYARIPLHPGFAAVKQANSRAFALSLERRWAEEGETDGLPYPVGYLCDSLEAIEDVLAKPGAEAGWTGSGLEAGAVSVGPERGTDSAGASWGGGRLIKGDHGHAGIANRRVPAGQLCEKDRAHASRLLQEHGRVVVEPWLERLCDMAYHFHVGPDGSMDGFRGHELLNSRDGAFLGAKISASRLPPEPWAEPLRAAAKRLAAALHGIGYFGPVGVDAIVWKSPRGPRLRPWVDINARRSMAHPAHGLAARLSGKTLLWNWSKPRKLKPIEGYAELDALLGEDAFDARSKRGIMAVSPLRTSLAEAGEPARRGVEPPRPKRVSFLISADDETDLARLRDAFAHKLGRA